MQTACTLFSLALQKYCFQCNNDMGIQNKHLHLSDPGVLLDHCIYQILLQYTLINSSSFFLLFRLFSPQACSRLWCRLSPSGVLDATTWITTFLPSSSPDASTLQASPFAALALLASCISCATVAVGALEFFLLACSCLRYS